MCVSSSLSLFESLGRYCTCASWCKLWLLAKNFDLFFEASACSALSTMPYTLCNRQSLFHGLKERERREERETNRKLAKGHKMLVACSSSQSAFILLLLQALFFLSTNTMIGTTIMSNRSTTCQSANAGRWERKSYLCADRALILYLLSLRKIIFLFYF